MDTRKSIPISLRERLSGSTGRVIGTFLKLPATEAVDIVALAGFDFAIVDREHSQLDEGQALRLVRHASAIGLPVVVRVPDGDAPAVNRLLEAGAQGIQLSSVRSVEQVRALVEASRYAPAGSRSVSLAHPMAGYGAVPLREAVGTPPALLIGQIETAEMDDPIDEILAGLDVAFLGITDLTVALEFDAERLRQRVEEVAKAAHATDTVLGAFASDAAAVPEGARYVALSSDLALLRTAANRIVDDAR
jgi:2-keto-3-deoxy-L-rhamnonate aldolase RhmA